MKDHPTKARDKTCTSLLAGDALTLFICAAQALIFHILSKGRKCCGGQHEDSEDQHQELLHTKTSLLKEAGLYAWRPRSSTKIGADRPAKGVYGTRPFGLHSSSQPIKNKGLTYRWTFLSWGLASIKSRCYRGALKSGCSSMAEHELPKLVTRVRFPSPAQRKGVPFLGPLFFA